MDPQESLDALKAQQAAGQPLKFLFFWGHRPERDGRVGKGCFSQWWPSPFTVDGIEYATAEHWMMAGKARLFGDESTRQRILDARTPAEAKKLGRLVQGFDEQVWAQRRYELVAEGTPAKFSRSSFSAPHGSVAHSRWTAQVRRDSSPGLRLGGFTTIRSGCSLKAESASKRRREWSRPRSGPRGGALKAPRVALGATRGASGSRSGLRRTGVRRLHFQRPFRLLPMDVAPVQQPGVALEMVAQGRIAGARQAVERGEAVGRPEPQQAQPAGVLAGVTGLVAQQVGPLDQRRFGDSEQDHVADGHRPTAHRKHRAAVVPGQEKAVRAALDLRAAGLCDGKADRC